MSTAVTRTRRRQQPEETRRQILQAAEAFLRERSYREMSVDALMARTGHTRTVFYRHFDDLSSVVLALMAEVGAELVEVGRTWGELEHASREAARTHLAAFVDFHARNGVLVAAIDEAAHHDDEVERAYTALVEQFIAITETAIAARLRAGALGAELDAPEAARALVWMLNRYLLDAFGGGRQADRERVLDTVTTIWTRTLYPVAR